MEGFGSLMHVTPCSVTTAFGLIKIDFRGFWFLVMSSCVQSRLHDVGLMQDCHLFAGAGVDGTWVRGSPDKGTRSHLKPRRTDHVPVASMAVYIMKGAVKIPPYEDAEIFT